MLRFFGYKSAATPWERWLPAGFSVRDSSESEDCDEQSAAERMYAEEAKDKASGATL